MDKRQADKILTEVKNSYEIIADHFSRTRYRDWSEFTIFKNYIKDGKKHKFLKFYFLQFVFPLSFLCQTHCINFYQIQILSQKTY